MNEKKEKNQNYTASCRLNKDQMNKLDAKALEKGTTRAVLIKHIILQYIDEEIEHTNILQAGLSNLQDKVEKNTVKLEFFQQLFYHWLSTWFASHPKIEENSQTIFRNSILRRDSFCNKFVENFYKENEDLFDKLFANHIEEENDD